MHRTIDFPNIGIHLKSVGDHITIFGFDIAFLWDDYRTRNTDGAF